MSVANTVDPKGRTSTARHKCCKSHPWKGHEMGFLKGQDWIHRREQMVFQSEYELKHFCELKIRKGKKPKFLNLNPKERNLKIFCKSDSLFFFFENFF